MGIFRTSHSLSTQPSSWDCCQNNMKEPPAICYLEFSKVITNILFKFLVCFYTKYPLPNSTSLYQLQDC